MGDHLKNNFSEALSSGMHPEQELSSEQTINIYGVTLEDQPKESSRQEVYREQ